MNQDTLNYTGKRKADIRFQDGALPHAVGVKSFQVLRACRNAKELADGYGWTYNHAPMLAWFGGYFYLEYLSDPVSEHETPGHVLLCRSKDGMNWEMPFVIFPEIEVPTAQYRGPRSGELKETMLTVPHHRMGFYQASNGVMLVLSFYGIVHDREISMPCDGWGVGRVVRRLKEDGSLSSIHFIKYNEIAGYTRENTPVFSYFEESVDQDFILACRELLANKPVIQQWYEEQRFDRALLPYKGKEALCFYTVSENEMIGVFKTALTMVSRDKGNNWEPITENPTIQTNSAKVWGQRTSDGKFALLYNPTTNGQHRWPIAIVTGENGHDFDNMLAVTAHVSPTRYAGLDKNLGCQYLRGICEVNPQSPDGDIWITYSNNKEDIWVSHIPVPVRGGVDTEINETFGAIADGELPDAWNIYSPKWAPVRVIGGELVLRDKDPYDRAYAQRTIRQSECGSVGATLKVHQITAETKLLVELLDDRGSAPISLAFMPDGFVHVRSSGRAEPWAEYKAGESCELSIGFDCHANKFNVTFKRASGETAEGTFRFSESVYAIERVRFATKTLAQMKLNTLDDNGKYGALGDLPNADIPLAECRFALCAFSAKE